MGRGSTVPCGRMWVPWDLGRTSARPMGIVWREGKGWGMVTAKAAGSAATALAWLSGTGSGNGVGGATLVHRPRNSTGDRGRTGGMLRGEGPCEVGVRTCTYSQGGGVWGLVGSGAKGLFRTKPSARGSMGLGWPVRPLPIWSCVHMGCPVEPK